MKIRNGFVSNSSSSSFVIFWKKDFPFEELQKQIYDNLPKEEGILKEMISPLKNYFTLNKEYVITEDNYKEQGYSDSDEIIEKVKTGYNAYYGGFSDEEPGIESALSWIDIDFKTDNWEIKQDGGY